MKKILMTLILLLLACGTVMAEENVTKTSETGSDGNLQTSAATEFEEVVPRSYTWSIPSKISIENLDTSFELKVDEAHLNSGEKLVIGLSDSEDKSFALTNDTKEGSGITLLNADDSVINDTAELLSVTSHGVSDEAIVSLGTIKVRVNKRLFSFAGTYNHQVMFTAQIK